jgi:hypothetical protein
LDIATIGFSLAHNPKADNSADRGKTVTKPLPLSPLGLALSEKQIPQVVENFESGDKRREALEWMSR